MGSEKGVGDPKFHRFWKWRLNNSPEFATSIGVHDYDHRLDEMSLGSYIRRQDTAKTILQHIKKFDNEHDELPSDVRLNLSLLISDLEQFIDSMHFKPFLMPLNMLEGPQIDFLRLLTYMKNKTVDDINVILSRMRLFSQQIDETIALLNEGIRLGVVMHRVSVETLPSVLKNIADEEVHQSLLFKPFLVKPTSINDDKWNLLVNEAKEVIDGQARPAYMRLSNFIRDVYLGQTRSSIAASSLPNGKEYYAACLKFHTTTNLTPQEVHDIGVREVKRITQCMVSVKELTNYNGSLKDFRTYLSTDNKFKFKDSSGIVSCYKNITKEIETKLSDYFQVLPKCPYEVAPIPAEVAPTAPFAYYEPPPLNGCRPGTFFINTYKPESRKRYEAVPLCLHEAVPGHHLQICLTMESASSPDFRRFFEARKFYEPPARFSMNTGYIEGWGLYSEYLGEEMGLYTDPYDMFGRLSYEMLRACRLVVDTGIHMFGWSREQAINYMQENTALDIHGITAEIDRYITWPGQACGYKIGELKIKELRVRAEEKLGEKFNLRLFHHTVASMGGVPLNVLEDQIDIFINEQLCT